jgi:hypothetical protein
VFTPISVCLGVLSILAFLQAGLASGLPIPAGALTPPFVEGEVTYIELLFPRFTRYVEEELASVLNLQGLTQTGGVRPEPAQTCDNAP